MSRAAALPPPARLRPAVDVLEAELLLEPPPYLRRERVRGRRAEGLRYERRAKARLAELLGADDCCELLLGPWIRFRDAATPGAWRFCQPDALWLDPLEGRLVLIEIKLQHTPDAWWQCEWLYRPVLERLFAPGEWQIAPCEVVKWFDPAVPFPCRPAMLRDPRMAQPDQFGVHILAA